MGIMMYPLPVGLKLESRDQSRACNSSMIGTSGDDARIDQVICICFGFCVPPPSEGDSSRDR